MTIASVILHTVVIFFIFMFLFRIFRDIWDAAYDRGYRQAKLDNELAINSKIKEKKLYQIHTIYMN